MHACIHAYLHACIHAYMHKCIHAYMHTCIHAYMHTCIHAYMHTCIHAYIHTCIHAYMHTCIHTYMHTCIHAYIGSLEDLGGVERTCGSWGVETNWWQLVEPNLPEPLTRVITNYQGNNVYWKPVNQKQLKTGYLGY